MATEQLGFAAAAPGGVVPPRFTTTLGSTFQFLTPNNNFDNAEKACQTTGGHLAVFLSLQEQQEVERYYISVSDLEGLLAAGQRPAGHGTTTCTGAARVVARTPTRTTANAVAASAATTSASSTTTAIATTASWPRLRLSACNRGRALSALIEEKESLMCFC